MGAQRPSTLARPDQRLAERPERLIAASRDLTTADYFEMLLSKAGDAAAAGNYGIAAALVVRSGGQEVVSLASNTLFADRDPAGHAEMNAIRCAHAYALNHELTPPVTAQILRRPAPNTKSESILFATLEPCPMCTVCAINAGVSRVLIATPDPLAGSMSPQRLAGLPPLWGELATQAGRAISFCQSDDVSDTLTYLPLGLLERLEAVFERTRAVLDGRLSRAGVLDTGAITAGGTAAEPN